MAADSKTLAQKNADYWDSVGEAPFKTEWVGVIIKQITTYISPRLELLDIKQGQGPQNGKKMLDYACGNGFMSKTFKPYFDRVIGIDVAQGMTDAYNKNARQQGFTEAQMHGYQGDLTDQGTCDNFSGDDFFNFDFIAICLALHHIEDGQGIVRKFMERLRPGGTLLIIDWMAGNENIRKYDTHSHTPTDHVHVHDHELKQASAAAHTVAHLHFSRDAIEGMLKQAGATHIDIALHPETSNVPPVNHPMQLFFAIGRK